MEIVESPKKNNSYSYNNNNNFSGDNSHHKNQIIEKLDKGKNLGTFILGQKLGSGTFGVVRLATHIITGEKVAVKILDKYKILKEADKRRLEREIKILKILRHNNIVHLYNVIQTSSTIYLVMEYVDGNELFEYIVHKRRLSELEACKFYQQLISGVEYLGKLGIAHRDLKPENLLLDKKKNIKIVDFGLSNLYRNNELLCTACGSPCYAAPEMLNGKRYNGLQVDIWSSGIVLYAMICGTLPFEDPDNNILYKKIKQGNFNIPEFVSDKAKDILHRILNIDPAKRYTIEQIKSHPWFNMINPKLYMSEGLLLNTYIVPIDEDIINQMSNEYEYNSVEVRINLLANKHNHLTTTYYLLLKKKIQKGEKSICNTFSIEFIKYINNHDNLLSNYKGNWKKLFKDRAREKYMKSKDFKGERKISNNSKQEIQKSYKNISKFEPNENSSKAITNSSTNTDKYDKKSTNKINIPKSLNNDVQYNTIANINNKNENNIQLTINNEIKKEKNTLISKINNNVVKAKNGKKDSLHPPVKKVTIFEYLKKIKELGNKKYSKDDKKNFNNSIEKGETIHIKRNNPNGNRNNRLKNQNKKFKEYENKLKVDKTIDNNNKGGKHKYSISTLNSNTIDKELYYKKFNNLFNNNLFDLKNYLEEKQNNVKTRNKNILIENNNINTNTINFDQQKNKNNKLNTDIIINDFSTIDHDDYPVQITSQSKKSYKRYIKDKKGLESSKYVESKYYFTKKNQDKSKDYLINSYINIDKTITSNRNIKNRSKKSNNSNNISYKNRSYNNKNTESSLKKRKKYCQSISSKLKKHKNDNKSTLLINKNNYNNKNVNNTIEIINSRKNMHMNHLSSLISNSSSKKTYSKRIKMIDNEDSYGVNYIVQKKKIKNGLFNSNNYNRKRFFNTSISFEKTDGDTSNEESQTKKINKINNNNYIFINVENYNEPINKANDRAHKNSKDIESYYESNIKNKEKDKIYLDIKSKYKKFINNQDLFYYNNSKGNYLNILSDLNYESKKNISKLNYNINNYRKRNRINKSVCLKNSTYENYRNAFCNNPKDTSHKKKCSKRYIFNNSKKLILNNMSNYIINTQKQLKYIRKRKIINNDFSNTTDEFLGKSYGDNPQDKMPPTTFDSYDLNFNNSYINNNKCNKMIVPKKISYTSFDLNTAIFINDRKRFNLIINKELENKKIKYIFKNNKYLCWRNDNKLMIQIIKIGKNCYAINMHIIKQSNFFNIVFLKEFFKNIVNKYNLNK
jgi:5'-AMP-activated protein kinase catalytic alpha subunit